MKTKPLSLYTSPNGRRYIDLADVAEITALPGRHLDLKYRPYAWAMPRDFRWEHGRMWFAELSLPQLVDSLFDAAQTDAAIKLRTWLAQHLAETFDAGLAEKAQPERSTVSETCSASAPVAPAARVDSAPAKSWAQQWEESHQ